MNNDDLIKTLEITNGWINNCDTKNTIALGIHGILGGIFFSTSLMSDIIHVTNMVWNDCAFYGILYIYFFL